MKVVFSGLKWTFLSEILQASFHAQGLSVLSHVDDVFPVATAGLRQLRAGIAHFGWAQETAVLGKVAVRVRVFALFPKVVTRVNVASLTLRYDSFRVAPVAVIVAVGIFTLLGGRNAIRQVIGALTPHFRQHGVQGRSIAAQESGQQLTNNFI